MKKDQKTDMDRKKAGRPRKEDILYHNGQYLPRLMLDWFARAVEVWTSPDTDQYERNRHYPTLANFCRFHGLDYSLITKRVTDRSDVRFAPMVEAWETCKEMTASLTEQMSMTGVWSAAMAQFLLRSRFGYSDKQEIAVSGGAEPVNVNIKVI